MDDAFTKIFTVMLEPASGCNIDCRHCYATTSSRGIMGNDILSAAVSRIMHYAEEMGFVEVHFIWHGGEPLLAGRSFFEDALRRVEASTASLRCRHFIQTNGLLVDEAFCSLFREAGISIGVSLDGPADLHDCLRVDYGGIGTHAAVMKKTHLLEHHQVPFGFCSVVSRLSVGQEQRIYSFFKGLGHAFRVNPIIPSLKHDMGWKYLFRKGEYGGVLCRLFDEWAQDGTGRVPISPLNAYLLACLDGSVSECQQSATCAGTHLGIKPNGTAVVCCRFETHVLGDIRETPVDSMFSAHFCEQLQSRAAAFSECSSCINRPICHGGCPHNSLAFSGDPMTRDPFCTDYMAIFSYLRRALQSCKIAGVEKTVQQ
jgi:uncharacterized protein